MDLAELKHHWNSFGERDPLGAILADPARIGGRWERDEFFATGRSHIEKIRARIRDLGLAPAHSRALDFGSGVGRVTQALAEYFDEVHGVDIAPSMVRLAADYNRHGPRCIHHVNDQPDLRIFPDAMFDLVHSHITLQHIEPRQAERYLAELVRVLQPGGVLVFQLPSRPQMVGKPMSVVVKDLLKAFGPRPVVDACRRLAWQREHRAATPRMEMHGVSPRRVVGVVRAHGGRVVDRVRDDAAAPGWVSFQYFVVKGRDSGGGDG